MTPEELKQQNLKNNPSAGIIYADSLNNTTPFKTVTPSPLSNPDVSYQGLLESLTNQENQANAQAQAIEKQNASIQTRSSSILEKLGLRTATQQQKETQLGVPQLSETVRTYRTNLANLEGQAATMRERVTEANRATGRSGYDLNLIESGAQRTNAIDRISTASLLQAAQGNLADARAEAERATNLEFEPKEVELKMLQQQLADNKDMLTRYDSKATAALENKLRVQEKQIALGKEESKAKRELVLQAVQFGVDQNTLSKMQKAGSIDEAISIAGSKLRDPKAVLELQRIKLDMALTNAQISNQYDQIRSRKAEDAQKASLGGLTPAEARTQAKEQKEAQAQKKAGAETAISTRNIADSILTKMKAGVGNSVVGGSRFFNFGKALPGSSAADLQNEFATLRDNLALGNIDKLKGAMSDKDIEFLRNTATSINLNSDEGTFRKGLEAIIQRMDAKIGSTIESSFDTEELDGLDTFLSNYQPVETDFDPNNY